jgi:hypothetical protein
MRVLASLALAATLAPPALAQTTLSAPEPPTVPSPRPVLTEPEQKVAPAQSGAGPHEPVLPSPPSPEATTPANPLQPQAVEGSPPSSAGPAQPLPPAPSVSTPLQQSARVTPEAASYLREIGIDPEAPDIIEVSQDTVGDYSLDALAAAHDETRLRRFIYTRLFMHHFIADSDNLRIEPDKYDITFLSPEEVNLIAEELNK